jgi:hypothetical protein
MLDIIVFVLSKLILILLFEDVMKRIVAEGGSVGLKDRSEVYGNGSAM